MEFFRIKKDIPFMSYARTTTVVSAVTFVLAVFFLFTRGLNLSVEFTGGTVMELHYSAAIEPSKVQASLAQAGYTDSAVQNFGTSADILVRLPLKAGVS